MMLLPRTLRDSFVAIALLSPSLVLLGQTSSETTSIASSCTVANNVYTCNPARFQQTLSQAKTAAMETGPVDPAAQTQLKKLFVSLGLTAPADGQPADVTFLLVPVDPQAVDFNTGDGPIAALHVFARRSGPGRGDLIWAENFIGPHDIPWPIVVNRLVLQFKSRFHIKDAPKGK